MSFYYKKTKTQDERDILFIHTPRLFIKSSFSRMLGQFTSFIEIQEEGAIIGMGVGDTAHDAIRDAIKDARNLKVLLNTYLKSQPDDSKEIIKYLGEKVQRVYHAGHWGIAHVGAANYRERQKEARDTLDRAMWNYE